MDIGVIIFALLENLTGTNIGSKVRPDIAAQADTLPFIIYRQEDRNNFNTKNSYGGIGKFSVNIACYADDRTEAQTIGKAVKDVLERYTGTPDGVTGQTVTNVYFQNESSDYIDNNDIQSAVKVLSFDFWLKSTT